MGPYVVDAPVVIIHNYLETFREFLTKSGDESLLLSRRFNGDQALYWLGQKKLLITSVPIENSEVFVQRWGYSEVVALSPREIKAQISLAVMEDENLISAIENFAGEQKAITLVSYAATPEFYVLAEYLETKCGLHVHMPEAPVRKLLWLKNYIDSKAGFRELAQRWIGESFMPEGYITSSLLMVSELSEYFAKSRRGVVVKENIGGSGVGNLFFQLADIHGHQIEEKVKAEIYQNTNTTFVIEEFIQSTQRLSPSLEFYVPPIGKGNPIITYLCNQHFEESGRFAGVIIAREFYESPWYVELRAVGLVIAAELQKMGYVGHFDLDTIISDDGQLYLVEINSRRTGGTYVHEFLTHKFGKNYSDRYAALSQNKINTQFTNLDALEEQIGDLRYGFNEQDAGVIVLLTSQLAHGKFGYLILGHSTEEVLSIRTKLLSRL